MTRASWRQVIFVMWLWHMYCVQTDDSCGVTVIRALCTDHQRFIWYDCDIMHCVQAEYSCDLNVAYVCAQTGDCYWVTVTYALWPVILVVWLWHMHSSLTGDSCGVTTTHDWLTDRWFLWCDYDTWLAHRPVILVVWLRHMIGSQTGGYCGVTLTHALFTDKVFLWCDCGTGSLQTSDSCGVTVTHLLCIDQWYLWFDYNTCIAHRPVILVVWLWHMYCV